VKHKTITMIMVAVTGLLLAAMGMAQATATMTVEWLPPVVLDDWALNENATLPIKFRLWASGTLVCDSLTPTLMVNSEALPLRFDPGSCQYMGLFRPTQAISHTAIVSMTGVYSNSCEFMVVQPGKPQGKGHGGN